MFEFGRRFDSQRVQPLFLHDSLFHASDRNTDNLNFFRSSVADFSVADSSLILPYNH